MRKIDRKCLSYVFSSKGDSLEFDVLILHVPIFCRISCCLFGATDTLWIYIYFYYNTFFFFLKKGSAFTAYHPSTPASGTLA